MEKTSHSDMSFRRSGFALQDIGVCTMGHTNHTVRLLLPYLLDEIRHYGPGSISFLIILIKCFLSPFLNPLLFLTCSLPIHLSRFPLAFQHIHHYQSFSCYACSTPSYSCSHSVQNIMTNISFSPIHELCTLFNMAVDRSSRVHIRFK